MEKKNLLILLIVLALFGSIFIYKSYYSVPLVVVRIVVNDQGFTPSEVRISKNTRIVWVNEGSVPHWPASDFHPTHGIYPEFDPMKGMEPREEWTFKFNKIGNWRFHDHLNPGAKGMVIVE